MYEVIKMKKYLSIILALLMLVSMAAGCTQQEEPEVKEEAQTIRVGAMTGPTSMGMVKLMDESDKGESENTYEFTHK